MNPYKISCSHFYKLKEYNVGGHTFSLLKCKLITGRTHQIRLHLQHLGMAVVGDRVYPRMNPDFEGRNGALAKKPAFRWRPRMKDEEFMGSDVEAEKALFGEGACANIDWFLGDHHALHAHTLRFRHPTTDKVLDFKVGAPSFFEQMVKSLEVKEKLV